MLDLSNLYNMAITYGLRFIYALLILFIGLKVVKMITKAFRHALERAKADASVSNFLTKMVEILLKVVVVIVILGMFGVEMASLIAILAAASFAVGMALQGSLANFAGGVLILILRPFTVGNYIESPSGSGTVTAIDIFYTHLLTPDNKVVVVPNGQLSNAATTNYSMMETRRVDLAFGVSYDSDIAKVKETLGKVIEGHSLVLKDPAPFIRLSEHGDSALVYTVRVWTQAADYWTVHFDLLEQAKEALDAAGIDIPYPHMNVLVAKDGE